MISIEYRFFFTRSRIVENLIFESFGFRAHTSSDRKNSEN